MRVILFIALTTYFSAQGDGLLVKKRFPCGKILAHAKLRVTGEKTFFEFFPDSSRKFRILAELSADDELKWMNKYLQFSGISTREHISEIIIIKPVRRGKTIRKPVQVLSQKECR